MMPTGGMTSSASLLLRTAAKNAARRHGFRLQREGRIALGEDLDALADRVAELATDLSFLAEYLEDRAVVEMTITSDRQLWVEREGRIEPMDLELPGEKRIADLVRQLAAFGGLDPDALEPLVDVRLRDGTRVLAALPPIAFRGPTLCVRKATREAFTLESLVEFQALDRAMQVFLSDCVRLRSNVLLTTGPGVSASATVNALFSEMPASQRVVAIENGIELHVEPHRHATTFEPRGETTVSRLLDFVAGLQADRLVIGSIRGRRGDRGEVDVQPVLGLCRGAPRVLPRSSARPPHGIVGFADVPLGAVPSHRARRGVFGWISSHPTDLRSRASRRGARPRRSVSVRVRGAGPGRHGSGDVPLDGPRATVPRRHRGSR
ncbi:MAG: CpaF family protein [Myxococcales bacterium]|nr:CpaF family protein [Myxococcales bacterium]